MEADWEVEIGGGAPVIEALWPGYIDLRAEPERIAEVAEAADFAPLAALLLALNASDSPLWTSKCDRWQPEPGALAVYVDLLPRQGAVFGEWPQAEVFCREYVARLEAIALPDCVAKQMPCRIDFVIRQAVAGAAEGFGITAYLSAGDADAMAALMAAFAAALPTRQRYTLNEG